VAAETGRTVIRELGTSSASSPGHAGSRIVVSSSTVHIPIIMPPTATRANLTRPAINSLT
jgi:hypothetical protein